MEIDINIDINFGIKYIYVIINKLVDHEKDGFCQKSATAYLHTLIIVVPNKL